MKTHLVNLQELASQLEQTAKSIEAKLNNSENRFNIPTSALIKKIPELEVFGTNTIFQARLTDEGMRISIPNICKSIETEKTILQLPNLEEFEDVKYINYVIGLGGYGVIEIKKTLFQVGLIANLDLEDDDLENIEGEGIPPSEVLGFERRPEIPLKSDQIPVDAELIVISNGKKSREYHTALCDLKIISTGEIIRNVICNSALERLIKKYGSNGNCKFKITRKGKVKDGKTKVTILDLNGMDFSDIEV